MSWVLPNWSHRVMKETIGELNILLVMGRELVNKVLLGFSIGEGNGTPLQYSCLENPMDRGAWWAAVHGVESTGSLGVGHNWAASLSLFTFMHWRRKWQPTPVFLPGESQGPGSLGELPSMGSHRVGHDWSDLAAAAGFSIWRGDNEIRRKKSKQWLLSIY